MRLEKWPTINRPIIEKNSNGRCLRKVRSFWSNGFSASIILPDRTLRPGRKLQGKVQIHSKALVTFAGLRVQLDAQCTLFLEKNGELITKRFSILQTESNINAGRKGSNGSTIYCDAVDPLSNSKEIYALIPDINSIVDASTFPFCLEIPGDLTFPCPFNNSQGTLVFKLSAHLCSQDLRYAQIAEEQLDFKGYSNLTNNLDSSKQINLDRPLSLQTLNEGVTASFKVESSGFLPEEAIHFTLQIKNPKRLPMHMRVFLAQRVTYTISENCWKKVTSTVVRCERAEVNFVSDGEVVWRGALIIPKGQVPSFSSANNVPSYGVMYNIQFKVEGLDQNWSVKGSAPLYMGTCRTPNYNRLTG